MGELGVGVNEILEKFCPQKWTFPPNEKSCFSSFLVSLISFSFPIIYCFYYYLSGQGEPAPPLAPSPSWVRPRQEYLSWDQYCFSILWRGTFGEFCPKISYFSQNYTGKTRFFPNISKFFCEKEKYRQKKILIRTCQNWETSDFLSRFLFLQVCRNFPISPKKFLNLG